MLKILKDLQKSYGNITIDEIIKKLEIEKEIVHEYWIHKSLIGNFYVTSSKKDWQLILCKTEDKAEEWIEKLLKEDKTNGIKSIYKKEID